VAGGFLGCLIGCFVAVENVILQVYFFF
jgi:hypothetical protein